MCGVGRVRKCEGGCSGQSLRKYFLKVELRNFIRETGSAGSMRTVGDGCGRAEKNLE